MNEKTGLSTVLKSTTAYHTCHTFIYKSSIQNFHAFNTYTVERLDNWVGINKEIEEPVFQEGEGQVAQRRQGLGEA
jgi:hypothetical protein